MPAISKPVPGKILGRMRRKSREMGWKTEFAAQSGVSIPTITNIVKNGRAIPSVIEKLERALEPQNQ